MNLNPINSRLRVSLGGAIILAMFAALPARADTYQSTVLAQNPAGYWRLNETTQPAPTPPRPTWARWDPAPSGLTSPRPRTSCQAPSREVLPSASTAPRSTSPLLG